MRLHCLHIDGFGRFGTPSDFEFDPDGLTVVYGDNEKGKTTIKDAICATIFGFQTTDEKNKYRPWNATAYAARITFSSHGAVYCIERDFDTDEVTVWEVSKEKKIIFQGAANPRGWGADHEVYFDFIKEQVGFDSPDIFRLTTLVEQMQTKTRISDKIRQLISGSERADYTKVVKTLESELEEITKDIPGRNLRRKRKIEKIQERIAELSKAIGDAQEDLVTTCQMQAQIQTLEKETEVLKSESDAKKVSLEALGKYIQVEKSLSTSLRNLELLQKQSETLEDIRRKVNGLGSGVSGNLTKVLVISLVSGASISFLLWWVFENSLLLVFAFAFMFGLLILGVSYFLGLKTSKLKDIHIDENRQEEIEKEQSRLQQQIFDLDSLKEGILAKYPAFAQADVSTLLTMQEDMNQTLKMLEEKIEQKKNELYNLNARIGIIEQKATDFHFWEQEKKILEENLKYLERRKKALITALSVLKECIREYQFKYVEELESYITGAFKRITNGRYKSVTLEEDTLEPLVSTDSKSHIRKESLSIGALEQLYFAMRLSMSYLLSRNVALPFLLDDSFISYDLKRLENIKYILSHVKRTNQVILFVHDPFYKEWADTVIDLNRHHE